MRLLWVVAVLFCAFSVVAVLVFALELAESQACGRGLVPHPQETPADNAETNTPNLGDAMPLSESVAMCRCPNPSEE